MNPEDVPLAERILPDEKCDFCGAPLVVIDTTGCEEDLVYIGCPNGEGEDEHTEYGGQPRTWLQYWGWDL